MTTTIERNERGEMITTIDYGEVFNSTIITIFGNDMPYNDLVIYAKNKNDTTYLKVAINTYLVGLKTNYPKPISIDVWFNTYLVFDKEYDDDKHEMFNALDELKTEIEEEQKIKN
jgi:hypothetical protein